MFKLRKDRIAYIQVGNHILTRISKGELNEGDSIGTIRFLSKEYKVTTKTIQKALDFLEDKDVISRVQSSGVFVKINSVVAKQMLVSEARDLTAVYLEDLRQINNIDIVLELIEGGINNDKS